MVKQKQKNVLDDYDLNALEPENFLFNDTIPPDDTNCIFVNGKKVGSLGNIVAITGKPKSRKSVFIHAMLAGFICAKAIFNIECILPEKSNIVFLDTEQSKQDLYTGVQRIKKAAGVTVLPNRLKIYRTRSLKTGENLTLLKTILQNDQNIKIIFIDGILDFINDMNNADECQEVISLFKKLTEDNNILIVLVLHDSKTSGQTLGHVGSSLERSAQSLLRVEKTDTGSTLSSQYMRSDEDFTPLSIYMDYRVNEYKLNPYSVRETIKKASMFNLDEMKSIANILFIDFNYLDETNLNSILRNKFKDQSDKFIKDLIARLKNENFINYENFKYFKA